MILNSIILDMKKILEMRGGGGLESRDMAYKLVNKIQIIFVLDCLFKKKCYAHKFYC